MVGSRISGAEPGQILFRIRAFISQKRLDRFLRILLQGIQNTVLHLGFIQDEIDIPFGMGNDAPQCFTQRSRILGGQKILTLFDGGLVVTPDFQTPTAPAAHHHLDLLRGFGNLNKCYHKPLLNLSIGKRRNDLYEKTLTRNRSKKRRGQYQTPI